MNPTDPPSSSPPPPPAEAIAADLDPADPDWPEFVRRVREHFRSETVTVHRAEPADGTLTLLAANPGLPEALVQSIRTIPKGRGMAGVAAMEKRPVTTCNLETDTANPAIRPGARAIGMRGAVVVPILAPDGETVKGTIGIGTVREHEYTPAEVKDLESLARAIGARLL